LPARCTRRYTTGVSDQCVEVAPGRKTGTVLSQSGDTMIVPAGWVLLPPGDAALTRRVKKAGPSWLVREKKGRKLFSRGLWAPTETIESIRAELAAERADPKYARKLEAGRKRREQSQALYAEDFQHAVYRFLAFAEAHDALAHQLAKAIADHAVPVGSGTVARTQRIPIERRAEAATIAWLRHATTGYDGMRIERVKGRRREVRRMLAEHSRLLLSRYRRGEDIPVARCLLRKGLST
jgi:hypothetical protein